MHCLDPFVHKETRPVTAAWTLGKHSVAANQISSPPLAHKTINVVRIKYAIDVWHIHLPFAATSYLMKVRGSMTMQFVTQISSLIMVRDNGRLYCLTYLPVLETRIDVNECENYICHLSKSKDLVGMSPPCVVTCDKAIMGLYN
jgi:hypothetical protein